MRDRVTGDDNIYHNRSNSEYVSRLERQVSDLQRKIGDLDDDLLNERSQHRKLKRKHSDLERDYAQLKNDYVNALKKNSGHGQEDVMERFRRLEEAVFGKKETPVAQRQFFVQQPLTPSNAPKTNKQISADLRQISTRPKEILQPTPLIQESDSRQFNQSAERRNNSRQENSSHQNKNPPKERRGNSRNPPENRKNNSWRSKSRDTASEYQHSSWRSNSRDNANERQNHQDNSRRPRDRQENSTNNQEKPPKRKRTRSCRQSRSEAIQDNPNHQLVVQDRLPQRNQITPNSSKEDRRRIDLTDKTPVNFSFASNGTRPSYPGITPMNCTLKSEPQNLPGNYELNNAPPSLMENPILELPSQNNSNNEQSSNLTNNNQQEHSRNNQQDAITNLNSRRTSNQKARDSDSNQQPLKEEPLEVALIEQQQQLAKIRVGPIRPDNYNENMDHQADANQSSKNKKRIAHQKTFETPTTQPTQIYMRIKTEKPNNDEQVASRCSSPAESEEENSWQPDEIQYYRDIISRLNSAKDPQSRQLVIDGMRNSNKLSRFLQFKSRYHRESR